MLQTRLESQLHIEQDEARRRQDQIQRELENILRRQQQLESTNERLQEKAVDIRRTLNDLELSEGQYTNLRAQSDDDLSLKDFVAVGVLIDAKLYFYE